MKCVRCQHENRSAASFARSARPPWRSCAPTVEAPLSATAKCCSECAHPSGRGRSPQHSALLRRSLHAQDLAEKILASKDALEASASKSPCFSRI